MGQVIYQDLTLEQFLKLPETKPPLEYVDGKVVQKVSPLFPHTKLEQTLWLWVYRHAIDHKLGECFIELRCSFGGESLVPDLVFYRLGRIPSDPHGSYLEEGAHEAPDLVVEILSPGQTVKAMSARLARLVEKGVLLAWLVQPRRKRVLVFRPGEPPATLELGDALDGEHVLPGFRLPLTELFGWLSVGSMPFPTRP